MIALDRHDHGGALGALPPIGRAMVTNDVHQLATAHVHATHHGERVERLVDDRWLIGGEHDLGPRVVGIDAATLRWRHILVAGEWHGFGWRAAERR